MSDSRQSTYTLEAIIVAIAPVVLFAVLAAHPFIAGRLPNASAVAAAAVADTTRWGLVHVATAVASGLVMLAFLALRRYLRDAGDQRYSAIGLPFVIIGSTLYAMLAGMEFAALAAAETSTDIADVAAAQAAVQEWFVAVLATSGLTFVVGVFAFVKGLVATRVLSPPLTQLVVIALTVMALSRVVPLSAAQFYAHGAAGILALWPLAYAMWTHPAARPATAPG